MSDFKGQAILEQVNKQAEAMAVVEKKLERGYAHLGLMLLEVAEMQYWQMHFDSFREYLKDVAIRSKKSAGQLQRYFLTVRDLFDTFTTEQLEDIGITKAIQLRQAKDYAIILPMDIITAALDPKTTAKELKKIISLILKMPEDDSGDWMDCEMEFMVSPEERLTIQDAINVAMRTDPVIKSTISKSAQMKEVMLRLSMEFLGAHSV